MIDSICFRVNNIKKYPFLLNALVQSSKKKTVSSLVAMPKVIDDKGKEILDPDMTYIFLRSKQYTQDGEYTEFIQGEKLTSSHYYLGWKLPTGDDIGYVEFNFSIPKLIYGTNVIQFVPHVTENSMVWDTDKNHDYKWNQEATYKRLTTLFRRFFDTYFRNVEDDIDFKDIEIRRIDIC